MSLHAVRRWRPPSLLVSVLFGCGILLCPWQAPSAAPWSACLAAATGLCFTSDHPASNEKIGVLVVIDNRVDDLFCIEYRGQSRLGNVIRYEAIYLDCGDSGPLQTPPEPIVFELPLGPLEPGTYTVIFDAPSGFSVPDPPKGPVFFSETLVVGPAVPLASPLLSAIEFRRAAANHYFVTTIADEINLLDTGKLAGWKRTGEALDVLSSAAVTSYATSPVCRLYGKPEAGLDSHFYSASPAECQATLDRFPNAWIPESPNVFRVVLPDANTGACPIDTEPIYRLFNNRADVNHRYTASTSTRVQMIADGWIAEGYGPVGVAMCGPLK